MSKVVDFGQARVTSSKPETEIINQVWKVINTLPANMVMKVLCYVIAEILAAEPDAQIEPMLAEISKTIRINRTNMLSALGRPPTP